MEGGGRGGAEMISVFFFSYIIGLLLITRGGGVVPRNSLLVLLAGGGDLAARRDCALPSSAALRRLLLERLGDLSDRPQFLRVGGLPRDVCTPIPVLPYTLRAASSCARIPPSPAQPRPVQPTYLVTFLLGWIECSGCV